MASLTPKAGCCDTLTLQEGKPTGTIQTICSLPAYVAGPLKNESGKYLVIFTDVYGYKLTNTQLVADEFNNKLGYTVFVPDILDDDPFDSDSDFEDWFSRHDPVDTTALCGRFMKKFKAEFKPKYTCAVGYCFGAKYLAQLMNGVEHGVDCGAFAHPSFVADDELKAITKPLLISAAETDSIFPRELRFKSEEILAKTGIRYQIDLFSGVEHGFAVRSDRSDPVVKYAAAKALSDQIHWFNLFDTTRA
ncbi:protein [Martiniozyma asiatica (nom. inval.)]|nr:protein [Martiniozyma asiatica]